MLVIGDIFYNIKCESFHDKTAGRIRVRPLAGQGLSTDLVIECSKQTRERWGVGKVFITESVKVCQKPTGRIYLLAKNQHIEPYQD